MPSKESSRTKLKNAAIAAKSAALPKIPKELLDQIVAEGPMTGEQINATHNRPCNRVKSKSNAMEGVRSAARD